LDGAAAARRGEAASWQCEWEGREAEAFSAPLGQERILLIVYGRR